MKNHTVHMFLLSLAFLVFGSIELSQAQESTQKAAGKSRPDKQIQQYPMQSGIDSLINARQFVFQAEFGQGSDMVFVIVDSMYAELQNGNRNNLQGRITEYEVKKNEKKKTIAINIKMRGEIYSGDIFLFIGVDGDGTATIKSEFPGNFSFNGKVVDFESAQIYQGPSHLIK